MLRSRRIPGQVRWFSELVHAVRPEFETGPGHRGAERAEPPTIMIAEEPGRGRGAI